MDTRNQDRLKEIKEQHAMHDEDTHAFSHYKKEHIGWLIAEVEKFRGNSYFAVLKGQTEEIEKLRGQVDELKPVYLEDGEGYKFVDTRKEIEKLRGKLGEVKEERDILESIVMGGGATIDDWESFQKR